MDLISILGLVVGMTAIVGGQLLEGGHIDSLVQPTAFLIVIGGTLGAVLLQSPLRTFLGGMRMLRWAFVPPAVDVHELIERIALPQRATNLCFGGKDGHTLFITAKKSLYSLAMRVHRPR